MSADYLTVADVLGLHATLLRRYGGAEGIRDMGAVESALFRPQCGYYTDIVEEACALLESLLINHPFVDGNKRTAFAACDVFLRINGKYIRGDSLFIYDMMIRWLGMEASSRFESIKFDIRPLVRSLP